MALNIFNIGKANARIAELEQQVATLTASAGANDHSTELAEALASNEQISAQLATVTAENATLKTKVAGLEGQVSQLQAAAATHKTAMTNLEASVNEKAAKKAQEINAGLGAPAAPAVDAAAKAPAKNVTGMNRVVAAAKADLERAGYTPKAA